MHLTFKLLVASQEGPEPVATVFYTDGVASGVQFLGCKLLQISGRYLSEFYYDRVSYWLDSYRSLTTKKFGQFRIAEPSYYSSTNVNISPFGLSSTSIIFAL